MCQNIVKKKLKNGEPTIGSWIQLADPSVAEIMGQAGYDWIAVDLEHGQISTQNLPNIFRSLELGGTVPFARIAQSKPSDIKTALDAGSKGVILPNIKSADMLNKCIEAAYYPPLGTRGVGYSRANLFGKMFDKYTDSHKSELVIVAQIEDIEAVEHLDQILAVTHLDAIIVGPYDLSGSMGITGQFEHTDFINAMDSVFEKAKFAKIPMGVHIVLPDVQHLLDKINQGYQFIAYGTDAVFLYNSGQNPIN